MSKHLPRLFAVRRTERAHRELTRRDWLVVHISSNIDKLGMDLAKINGHLDAARQNIEMINHQHAEIVQMLDDQGLNDRFEKIDFGGGH